MHTLHRVAWSVAALSLLVLMASVRPARAATWAEDALRKEADYIVNCSFTEYARNRTTVRTGADAYGAINVVRIDQIGPDWVRPGEGAMGMIGLMAAARQLKVSGFDITRYDRVLDRFFRRWVLEQKGPIDTASTSPNAGGFFERIHYNSVGTRQKVDPVNAGVTGQMVAAMWKYSEYLAASGRADEASDWLRQAWSIARDAGNFLQRNYNRTHRLVRSNSSGQDLWVSDSSYAAMAFRCLDRWATAVGEAELFDYVDVADNLAAGLQALKDLGTKRNFFRYRDGRSSGPPTYGDRIDQLCFLPYESDVLDVGEPFARGISDWWTNGSDGITMTFQATTASDWRHYGTRLRYFLTRSDPENTYIFPGATLQLAKVEWKHAHKTGDAVTLERARKRFEWVHSKACSNLWLGTGSATEANVPNGIIDWRDSTNYAKKAGDWERFCDTSASFIEVTLMLYYGIDTRYVPD